MVPSLLPPDEDATPEGDPHVLRSHVRCAPLTSGFIVCIANLMSEELLPPHLDKSVVCFSPRFSTKHYGTLKKSLSLPRGTL